MKYFYGAMQLKCKMMGAAQSKQFFSRKKYRAENDAENESDRNANQMELN